MRIEFIVQAQPNGWCVRRGSRLVGCFDRKQWAMTIVENLAHAATSYGDTAVVKVVADGKLREQLRFTPEALRAT